MMRSMSFGVAVALLTGAAFVLIPLYVYAHAVLP